MKKQILLMVLICLYSANSHAQTITADEMIEKMKCRSFDCYNSFMINKGFSFGSTETKSDHNIYLFFSDDKTSTNNSEMTAKNSSVIIIYNDGTSDVGFRTSEKSQYQLLFEAFKNKGFIVSSTGKSMYGGISSQYKSAYYSGISLMVTVEQLSKNGIKWTSYDFEVFN